jgi:hypothetical protein
MEVTLSFDARLHSRRNDPFEVSFRTNIRDADHGTPSGMRWLAAGLAMAPNIEILHFVLFCTRHTAGTTPISYPSSTAILPYKTVMQGVINTIPWIKDCCEASTLPNLLRVVLHVNARHGNRAINCFVLVLACYQSHQVLA